jgi:gluconolactonase
MSGIATFRLSSADIDYVGRGLSRPECIIAERDGTLWVSDNRGGATRIDPDRTQTLVGRMGGDPSGLAMDRKGALLVANIGDGSSTSSIATAGTTSSSSKSRDAPSAPSTSS